MWIHSVKPFVKHLQAQSQSRLHRFAREEDGVVTAFALLMVLMMCFVGGIGVDLMRNEMERTNVQNTLDRAVIAAADREQTLDPQSVVLDYFAKSNLSEFIDSTDVQVDDRNNFRTVRAIARGSTKNMFMAVLGRDTLPIGARSTAAEGVSNIEVSMVLDISGSMGGRKIEQMRTAAKEFVDIVMDGDKVDTTTISIVPYNGRVNAGSLMANYFPFTNQHTISNCVRFSDAQFNMPGLSNSELPERLAHVDRSSGQLTPTFGTPHCQTNDYASILPWSNSVDELKTHIDTLNAQGWTAIDLGVKWASILLDPTSQDEFAMMATNGHTDARFLGRPYNYGATGADSSMKVIVMMTDGANTRQYDLKRPFKTGMSDIFEFEETLPDGTERTLYSVYVEETDQYYRIGDPNDGVGTSGWFATPDGDTAAVNLSYVELYRRWPAKHIAEKFFKDVGYGRYDAFLDAVEQTAGQAEADANLANICQAAKNNGTVIFAVGFEAPDGGRVALQDCASTDTHYFDAEGAELSTAFASIARTITQLRLTE